MKAEERDELLIRLDERMEKSLALAEKHEQHLSKLNGSVSTNYVNIDRNHNRIVVLENIVADGFPLKLNKKQMASGISIIIMALACVAKAMGWL